MQLLFSKYSLLFFSFNLSQLISLIYDKFNKIDFNKIICCVKISCIRDFIYI